MPCLAQSADYSIPYDPFPDIYDAAKPAVVNIQGDKVDETDGSWDTDRNSKLYKGMGTGVVIDPRGYIITNHHVIAEIRKIQVTTLDKKVHTATLIDKDLETDMALIKISPEEPLPVMKLGNSTNLRVCQPVLAIGNPFGYEYSGTRGSISGLGRDIKVDDTLVYRNAIQIDAAINPGNSGGPLLNASGEMIGMNVAIRQGAEKISFTMPVDQVVAVASKLITAHTHKWTSHGMSVRPITTPGIQRISENPSSFRDENGFGMVVTDVEPDSPAEQAGIRRGDVLQKINGRPVNCELEFCRAFIGLKADDEVACQFREEADAENGSFSEEKHLVLTLATSRSGKAYASNRARSSSAPGISSTRAEVAPKVADAYRDDPVWNTLGIRATPIPKEEFQRRYAKYLPFYSGGVVVDAVKSKGPFMKAGIRTGDVLVGFHQWSVLSQRNLIFFSEQWPNLGRHGTIRVMLLRGNEHFYQDIQVE